MNTEDFDYPLPDELIAQYPAAQRDACRLLVLDRVSGAVTHRRFFDLTELLRPGDLLVFNNTRVIPARLFCRRPGGGKVELLFTEKIDDRTWKALVRPARRLPPGASVSVATGSGSAVFVIESIEPGGERLVSLASQGGPASIEDLLETAGSTPLPPYVRRSAVPEDREAYQTVYARVPGAVAAPTAGLHFTPEMLDTLNKRGVVIAEVTLHVGIGTFLPVKVADPADHVMHEERYELTPETAGKIARVKKSGGRVVAVGTTTVRVLEHCAAEHGVPLAGRGRTGLKILPPYEFKVVDALITNFHLPKSTLLMLVSAFASREHILAAYAEAVRKGYRFFSYGDAMAIV
jgi:S-adenosylmethionine:tRNA ribosyltransferase-isomerase